LIEYLEIYEADRVPLPIVAAWLHDRFTLIHPFQDGNGRVARALVNFIFLRDELFPVVIDRDEKSAYLDALEAADTGDVSQLSQMLANKEIQTIKRALSLTSPVETQPGVGIVQSLARAVVRRRETQQEAERTQFRRVDDVLTTLARVAREQLEVELDLFREELSRGGVQVRTNLDSGGTDTGTPHYYRWQVVESAKQAGQWANFSEDSRWIRALVRDSNSQLRLILSFHHVGRTLTGVAEVTAFADIEAIDVEHEEGRPTDQLRRPVTAMLRPFSLTWQDEATALDVRLRGWVSESLSLALREWVDTI
jgi:hypothetical protein